MLDFSFSELVVCFLVALIVLGPERLPGVARAVGRWTGKARTYMRNFTNELEREAQVSELRKQLEETQKLLNEQSRQVQNTLSRLGQNVSQAASKSATAPEAGEPAAPPATPSQPKPTQEHGG